jgi:two-component system, response regulator RegA
MSNDVLLLEDDDALRHHLGQRLARQGYQVWPCANLTSASHTLDALADLHAAILDQNVGNENGLDLISPLLHRFPSCKVLVLTGYGSIPAAVSATRLGACNYLTKPASIQDIIRALEGETATMPVNLPDAPPSLERLEWEHIQRVLDEHEGNISSAARVLGIHRRTLQRRLKKRPAARDYDRDRPSAVKSDID